MPSDSSADLSPLSCFYLDPHPKVAAGWLTVHHLRSQAHALGRTWCQIARELEVDLGDHPRSRGAYPDRPLTLAGSWAMATQENWHWFAAYTAWVYRLYERSTGRSHGSRAYVEWCWDALDAADVWVSPGPLTVPPIRGLAAGVLTEQAAVLKAARRVYAGLPPLETAAEAALWRLSAETNRRRHRWDDARLKALLAAPDRAAVLMPSHPVVKALLAALEAGATLDEVAGHLGVRRVA